MGLHFIGVDHSLRRERGATYMRVGRFVLAAAALAGWSVAMMTEVSQTAIITSLALVSGGVVMNSMVMELPTPGKTGASGHSCLALRHTRSCCFLIR